MSRRDLAQHAAKLLANHGIVSPPVPVERIAIQMGAKIARSAAEWSESGFLLRDGQQVIIGINSRNSAKRQRFSIAHELGHWFFHEGKKLIVDQAVTINKRDDVSSQATDRQEIEANQFAAELLMPHNFLANAIRQQMQRGVGSREELVTNLANEFDVSNDAMGWRLINLGFLSN